MSFNSKEIESSIEKLLFEAGIACDLLQVIPLTSGSNNQAYKVQTSCGTYVAKKYFTHEKDSSDRLKHEFSFLSYAQVAAPNWVPRAFSYLPNENMALYSFLEGTPFENGQVMHEDIEAAASFFCELNDLVERKKANDLLVAREACFSLNGHIELIQNRIHQLTNLEISSEEDREAQKLSLALIKKLSDLNKSDFPDQLEANQKCISPSDFGFHNALKANDQVYFIDFEYAGWDDPAKMVADFFSQIAVPAPKQAFDSFTIKVMSCFPQSEQLVKRAYFLWPLYQIKWCCIALNIFLPYHLARRKFSNGEMDLLSLKRCQLEKAKRILQSLEPLNALNC